MDDNWTNLNDYLNSIITSFNKNSRQGNNAKLSDSTLADLAVFDALSGRETARRIDAATAASSRSAESIKALQKAAHVGGSSTALQRLFDIEGILRQDGIGLQARAVKNGDMISLEIRPIDLNGNTKWGANRVWNVPISKNGHIIYNNQQRNDLLHAVGDKDGHLQLLNSAEAALNNVFNQLGYEGNRRVVQGINSSSRYKQALGWKRLNRLLNQETNKVVNGGSATTPYNARQLQELQDILTINGNAYRRDVTKNGTYFGGMFTNLLNNYFKGKGSFQQQEINKERYEQKLRKMALITSSMGVQKGWNVIKHSSEFSEILDNQDLALPALQLLGGLARLELEHGPVTDTHGLDMAYLNNIPATFIDFALSNSRKPTQATLGRTNFLNKQRGNAYTTHGRIVSTTGAKALADQGTALNDKTLDTTLIWTTTQAQFAAARKLREEYLTKQIDKVNYELKAAKSDQQKIDELNGKLNNLNTQLAKAQQQSLLSVRNGGFIIDTNRAQELAAAVPRTKSLSNELIIKKFKERVKANKGQKISEEQIMADAIGDVMKIQVGDVETFAKNRDAISYGARDKNAPINKDYVSEFLKEYKSGKITATGKTPFSILYGAKRKSIGPAQYTKYITPGAELRMEGVATELNDLIPWLYLVKSNNLDILNTQGYEAALKYANDQIIKKGLGVASENASGVSSYVKGLIETPEKLSGKNHMTTIQGVMNAALGRGQRRGQTTEQILDAMVTNLPAPLQENFKKIFTVHGEDIYRDVNKVKENQIFQKYITLYTQAASMAYGGDPIYRFFRNGQKDAISNDAAGLNTLYEHIRAGGNPSVELTGMGALALEMLEHENKDFGMPKSKAGTPLKFGYREFNALDTLFDFARAVNPSENINVTQSHMKDLATKTSMSRQRYQGLLDLYDTTQTLARDINTTESSIRAKKGFVFNIDQETLNNYKQHPELLEQGVFDEDMQSTVSNLPKLLEFILQGGKAGANAGLLNPIGEVLRGRAAYFENSLSKAEQDELIEQAGGNDTVVKAIAELEKTDVYKSFVKSNGGNEKRAKQYIRALVGSSMMPTFARVIGEDGAKLFWNNETGTGSEFLALPFLNGAGLYNDKLADVIDLGFMAAGGNNILNNIIATLIDNGIGTNIKSILPKLALDAQDLSDQWYEELTTKGKSVFDESQKVPMTSSFQAKVLDAADFSEVTKGYEKYVKNAMIITPKMLDQMLTPTKEILDSLDPNETWSNVLFRSYGEMMEMSADEVEKEWNKHFSGVADHDKKTADEIEKEKQKFIKGQIKYHLDITNAGKKDFNTKGLINGLMGLALRYPNILKDFDVLPTKILTTSAWEGIEEARIAGDPFAMNFMNADFDGDTMTFALALAQGAKGIEKVKGLRDTRVAVNKVLSLSRIYDKMMHPNGPESGKTKIKDLMANPETEGIETFLTKSGKSFTGLFSNIRQGFQNAVQDRNTITNITDNKSLEQFLATTSLGHFLGIFEQAGISAKKMTASELVGATTNLDELYQLIRNPEMWKTEKGFKAIIAKAQAAGVLNKEPFGKIERGTQAVTGNPLGLTADDSSNFRLAFTPFAQAVLLAQQVKGTKDSAFTGTVGRDDVLAGIGRMIGLDPTSKAYGAFINSLDKFKFNEQGDIEEADIKAAQEAMMGIIKAGGVLGFSEKGLIESYNTINGFLESNPVISPTGKKLYNISDIIGDKKNELTRFVAGRIYGQKGGENPLNIKSAPGSYTEEEKERIKAAGGEVLPEGYVMTPQGVANWAAAGYLNAAAQEAAADIQLGQSFFYNPDRLSNNEGNLTFNKKSEKEALDFSSTGNTPTRLINRFFPFIKKGEADYSPDQYNTFIKQVDDIYNNTKLIDEQRKAAINDLINSGAYSNDQIKFLARQFNTLEGGNLAHAISQGMLGTISSGNFGAGEKDFIKRFLVNGDNTVKTKITEQDVDAFLAEIKNGDQSILKLNGQYNAQPNPNDTEDHGGVLQQYGRYKTINDLLKDNPKWLIEDDELKDQTPENRTRLAVMRGLAFNIASLRAAGFVNPDGTLNEEKVAAARIGTELPILGLLNNRGEAYGRIDLSSFGYEKSIYQNPNAWRTLQQEAIYNFGDTEIADEIRQATGKGDLIAALQKKKGNKVAEDLISRLDSDTPGLALTITDFKTASHGGNPYASNMMQVLDYAIMARQMQSTIRQNASSVGDERIAHLHQLELEYQKAVAEGTASAAQKQAIDDEWNAFFKDQFIGGKLPVSPGNRAILEALTDRMGTPYAKMSDAQKQDVSNWLRNITLFDTIKGRLIKAGTSEASAFDINLAGMMANTKIQRAYGKMYRGENPYETASDRYDLEGEFFKYLSKTAGVDEVTEKQVSGQKYNALTALSKYKQGLARIQELATKTDRTYPEEKELQDRESAYAGTNAKSNPLNDVLKSLKGIGSAEDIKETLLNAGFSDEEASQFSNIITTGTAEEAYAFASNNGAFQSIAQRIIKEESDADKRATGSELNKWFKAKKQVLENNKTIKQLTLQHKGAELSGDQTTAEFLEDQISLLEQDNSIQQQTIDDVESLYRGNAKEGEAWQYGDNERWISTKSKYARLEAKQKKDDITDERKLYTEKLIENNKLTEQYQALQTRLLSDTSLTQEETVLIKQQLSELYKNINENVRNYIEGLRDKVDKDGSIEKALAKTNLKPLAIADAQIAKLSQKEQQNAKAFGIYSNLYNAQFALEQNQHALAGGGLTPTQRRLLELEQIEAQNKFELAEAERKKYEEENKGNPNIKAINDAQAEKAWLLYQEKLGQSNSGVINKFENKVGSTVSSLAKGYGLHRVLSRLIQTITKLVAQAINLDKVMANLRIVTGDSKTSTRALISEYANLGKAIGVTTAEVASSAVEWLRQGYETAEVLNLVKSSMYLSKLGMMDASTATQSLTSALKGFKLQASESMDVVDKLTAIDMKAATSAGEIAQGLAQFANLGSLAGVNIDQAAAYVATIADVTQMSGSSAGQALKTIISRYGNVKAGAYTKLNTESESSDENVNLNDVERVLSKLGISIRKSNLEFKSFPEVLEAVAERWDTLDSVSKKAVATAFAGIRQQEAFTTLLQNWDKSQELLQVSQNSKGTAEKKFTNAYKESYEAAKGSFTAALEDFMNRSEVNELLTKIVKFMTKMVDNLPKLIKVISQVFFAIQSIRSFTGESILAKGLRKLGNSSIIKGFREAGSGYGIGAKVGLGRRLFGGVRGLFTGVFGKQPKKQPILQRIGTGLGLAPAPQTQTRSIQQPTRGPWDELLTWKKNNGGLSAEALKAWHDKDYAKAFEAGGVTDADVKAYNKYTKTYNKQLKLDLAKKYDKKTAKAAYKNLSLGKAKKVSGSSGGGAAFVEGAIRGVSFGLNQMLAGVTAYEMIGQTHKNAKGEEVQSSEKARKAGGTTAMAWSTLLPIIGQWVGEKEAQKVMSSIDGARDAINSMSKQANEVVNALKSVDGSIETLSDIADSSTFDYEKMQEAIKGLSSTLYTEENAEARKNLQKYLGESLSDTLQTYENGTEEERKEAARKLKLASLEAQSENNEKIREAELYNQTRTDANKNQFLSYQKALYGNEYGVKDTSKITDASNYKGTAAAAATGAALITAGSITAAAGTAANAVPVYGQAAFIGIESLAGLMVGAGAALEAASGVIYTKEKEAAIAKAQTEEYEEFLSKDVFEQERIIQEGIYGVNGIIEQINEAEKNGGTVDPQLYAQFEAANALLTQIRDTTGLIKEQIKQRNDEAIQKAILKTKDTETGKYIDELTLSEMKNLGVSQMIELVADTLGEGYEGNYTRYKSGKISADAERDILRNLKSNTLFTEVLSGNAYTLSEALERAAKFQNDKYEQSRLQNFASALGVSVSDLGNMESRYGTLKLSELLQSTVQNMESLEGYNSLLADITDGSKSATKWMSDIVSKYPDLISYMSDTPKLMEKIMEKMSALMEFEYTTQWTELAKDTIFYKDLLTKTRDEVGYTTIKSGIEDIEDEVLRKRVQAFLDSSKATDFGGLLDEVIGHGYGSGDVSEEIQALGDILSQVGDKYQLVSDAYKEQLSNYIDYNSKLLEDQINNLDQQKQALQQINQQREYENRLVEAKLKLENAIENKQRVYRAGVGFVYEADQNAIREAQDELENVEIDKQVSILEAQTNILQSMKERWDTMYDKKSFELQQKQAEAFQSYILNDGDGGFQGNMGILATSMTAMNGGVQSLADATIKQMEAKEEKQKELLTDLGNAYINYQLSGEEEDLVKYQELYKEARNLGISNKAMDEGIAAQINNRIEEEEGKKVDVGKYKTKTGQTLAKMQNQGVDNNIKRLKEEGEKLGNNVAENFNNKATETLNQIKTESYPVWYVGGEWYRGYKNTETDAQAAIQCVMEDSIRGPVLKDPVSTASGTYDGDLAEVYVGDSKTPISFWDFYWGNKGYTHGGVNADTRLRELRNKVLGNKTDEYVQAMLSASGGPLLIVGKHGTEEYLLINADGSYQAVKPFEGDPNTDIDHKTGMAKVQINSNQFGTLSTDKTRLNLINEVGTEAIVTPSGTITALPAHTGVVPADITKNLWALGEIAPAILRVIGPSISPDHIGTLSSESVTDESFNINTLTMTVNADNSFDADAFVDSIKDRANLTKNIRR